jgi:hypothetical protein
MRRKGVTHPDDCPVAQQARQTQDTAEELGAMIRRLRRSMRRCPNCAVYADCPVLLEFNQAFRIALEEINEEWEMGSTD